MVERHEKQNGKIIDTEALLAHIEQVRRDGYDIAHDQLVEGLSAIAAPLPPSSHQRNLVLSIGGPSQRIQSNQDELVTALTETIARHFPED